MQSTILVPLDGSQRAEAILPTAVAVARATHCSLSLLQVIAPESPAGVWPASGPQWTNAWEPARAYLEDVAARVRQAGVAVTVEVRLGHAATRIVQATRQEPCISYIAMATHGHDGLPRAVFGQIAKEVVRNVAVPVLLVREGQPQAPGLTPGCTILVPLDGSAFARQALAPAQLLVRALEGTLLLVTVLPGSTPAEADAAPGWRGEAQRRETDRLTFEVEKIARHLEAGGGRVRPRLLHGKPGQALVAEAANAGVALIVMAMHSASGIGKTHWGSVAMEALRRTPAPVLMLGPHSPITPPEYTWNPDYVLNP